ncbi:MAG: hypothetical protein FWG00_00460 [Coriobacteriia bacterium]|nr:hypothetical protein [Coriobacteriia bacterium]MDR2714294.1 hypothetical protein [Coriobacteriales bacterium]
MKRQESIIQKARHTRNFRNYLIVVVVFFSFLLVMGAVIILERLLLGWAQ